MREGFTTGSCAAAAALASCLWQKTEECPLEVSIVVPEGRTFRASILPREGYVCGVIKDAGDDPDITDRCEVQARADIAAHDGPIEFIAGEGVGTVTLPGLKIAVSQAAINPVPRRMIEEAVRHVIGKHAARVTVSIPGGEALAKRTFNPRLGVMGGLSVLGTTGIVRPMSDDAIRECIALEIRQKRAQGAEHLAFVFGAQGEDVMRRYTGHPIVQMSNFVGFSLDEAVKQGVKSLVLGGHPGKMAKVAAGAMQTHSSMSDGRREALITALVLSGAEKTVCDAVWQCRTTDEMMGVLTENHLESVWRRVAEQAKQYCLLHVRQDTVIDVMLWDGQGTLLASTGEEKV